jgi:hypothetical protein
VRATFTSNKNILINIKMKKIILFALMFIFSLGAFTAFASSTDHKEKSAIPEKTENKLSEEEMSRLTKRVEEIRDMDKTEMTVKEKRELRKELKGIKENVKRDGGYVYIGTGTLLLIILIIVLI